MDNVTIDINGTAKRIGVALSGGGFRAAAFHLGAMRQLHQHDLLGAIDLLSCVSGGSIAGATIAMHWPDVGKGLAALEAYLTVLIELSWPKRRILEVYLNVVQFGPCTFGVAAASEEFFGKRAASVTAAEAALLAAVLPNPTVFRVDRPSPQVRERAAWIRRQMGRLGGTAVLQAR